MYDVIYGRYEQGRIALTSNRAPEEWPELFGDALLANAALDRLGPPGDGAAGHGTELPPGAPPRPTGGAYAVMDTPRGGPASRRTAGRPVSEELLRRRSAVVTPPGGALCP